MRYRAYAKVNVSLEVLGKRPDGYHDLTSVMQTIDLYDEIEVNDDLDLRFTCSEPVLEGDNNLVVRAARLLQDVAENRPGCSLHLHKAIPHAAGLGGGSSDAAATLRALNKHWSLHLSLDQLVTLGLQLGSDVPFSLHGGTALVSGRGEFVRPLPEPDPVWYGLIKPPISVPTTKVFDAVRRDDWTNGAATSAVAHDICERQQVGLGLNGLRRALFHSYPEARECFEAVARMFPGRTFVSGSGPTVGALCRSRTEAEQVVSSVARAGWWTAVVQSIPGAGE